MNFKSIEGKWQERWERSKVFEAKDGVGEKYYILEMFPYPSGTGLHMGHVWNYSIGDIFARYKRMNGLNVLHPMGFDSFGLPAENAAIKAKAHPKTFTEQAIGNFIAEMKKLGISYDWSRMVETHKPDYYKWDQWIFLKMLEKGLAYKKNAPVNWCSKCNTVLANEQVVGGMCWRHEDTPVEVKHLEQWFFKTTAYADQLHSEIDKLKGWPDLIKKLQRNWIGKSEGTEVLFEVNGENWPVFTTRVDTILGVSFLVVSAQHERLMELVTKEHRKSVTDFLKKVKSTKEEDMALMDKDGVFTGSYAVNPANGEKVPIWTGNFVLADYGSGMVMAVPAHDQRDFDFAKKYNLPIKQVIKPKDKIINDKSILYEGPGELINSQHFNGLDSHVAKSKITESLEAKKLGKKAVNYRLKDWLVSRQRFWGTPIPIVYCPHCGTVPVKEKDLPVLLPEDVTLKGVTNALTYTKSFVETHCPNCKGPAKRETDTMDTFVNSSWYQLRYADSQNDKLIFDKKKVNYWNPVDMYIGGKEHACLHLIYFRFYTKFLKDLGLLNFDEPAINLFNQGFILGPDGEKMSKSRGNVILPDDVIKKYGVDVVRFFLVSIASPDKDISWSDAGADGSLRFINRIIDFKSKISFGSSNKRVESKVNKAIKEISEDIESFKYNLAVIKIRELFEVIEEEKEISKSDFESFVKLLSPFCPHISEELWEIIGNKPFISLGGWPKADLSKIDEKIEQAEVAFTKALSDIMNVIKIVKEKEKVDPDSIYLYVMPNEVANFKEDVLRKKIGKEVKVFAVNDKNKYDPENKAGKAKPGKPGIYVE